MLLGGASCWSDMFGMLAVHEEVAEYVLNDKLLKELPRDFYATRSFTDFLIESIRENRGDDKPFFAYLAFTAPHDPMHVPEPWLSKYRGKSLIGVLAGSTQKVCGPDEFIGGEMQNGKWMRQGDFKTVSVAPPYGTGAWHLFNLADDPGETQDLAREEPELLKKLQSAWDHYAKDVGVVLTQ